MRSQFVFLSAITCIMIGVSGCSDSHTPVAKDKEVVQSRHAIINGTVDKKTSHNAVVGLYSTTERYVFCTGTLIHPQWVLTAGHCVADDYGLLDPNFVSTTKIGVGIYESSLKKYGASQVILHEKYGDRYLNSQRTKYTLDGDIALIKLSSPIPASVAKPILAHPKWLTLSDADMPVKMEFAGFGYTEDGDIGTKLTYTGQVKSHCAISSTCVVGKGYCNEGSFQIKGCHPSDLDANGKCNAYSSVNYTDYAYPPCGSIFYIQQDGGPCNGDSGGPAFDVVGGIEYVEGITSYGDEICTAFGMSTSVLDYYDWIVQNAPEVADQYVEICDNGYDDDGDGLVDNNDPDCAPPEPVCGDGIINTDDEECDGSAFVDGARKCSRYDSIYESGNVYCTSECKLSFDSCQKAPYCGDGKLASTEQCDGTSFMNGKRTCAEWDSQYIDGLAGCNDDCTINFDNCKLPEPEIPETPDTPDTPVVPAQEICNNGIDDDNDGLVDCSDADCSNECIPSSCGNGITDDDEECDGKSFLLDENRCHEWVPSYVSGFVTCNADCTINYDSCVSDSNSSFAGTAEICNNDIDDDHNGLKDCNDPACANALFCKKENSQEICGNGIDDDSNGLTDCSDPACMALTACQKTAQTEICGNGIDDDHNGLADCSDPACMVLPICAQPPRTEICGNNIDDDLNGKIDCEDPACAGHATCSNTAPVEICNNGIDDDNDGAADCNDADCKADAACLNQNTSICSNGIDDNGNGLVDCQDPICSNVTACANAAKNASSGSSCQATPMSTKSGSLATLLLALFGCGAMIRRRRES